MPLRYRYGNPLNQLRTEMDRLFSGFMAGVSETPWFGNSPQPAVNVWEEPDAVKVEAELPGVKNDQIDVAVNGAEMSLKINRPEVQTGGVVFHRRERPVGDLSRIVRLPVEIDSTKVQAEFRDGILTITLPKAEKAKPRKINVVAG